MSANPRRYGDEVERYYTKRRRFLRDVIYFRRRPSAWHVMKRRFNPYSFVIGFCCGIGLVAAHFSNWDIVIACAAGAGLVILMEER